MERRQCASVKKFIGQGNLPERRRRDARAKQRTGDRFTETADH
jgi:hypothetical protein